MDSTFEKKVHGDIKECPKCNETTVHPKITLEGDIMQRAGFAFGEKVQVFTASGHIVISRCSS